MCAVCLIDNQQLSSRVHQIGNGTDIAAKSEIIGRCEKDKTRRRVRIQSGGNVCRQNGARDTKFRDGLRLEINGAKARQTQRVHGAGVAVAIQ